VIEYLYSFANLKEDSGVLESVEATLTATDWQKAARETIQVDFSRLPENFAINLDTLTEQAMIQLVQLVIGDEMTRIKSDLDKRLGQGGDEQ
jgi:hypothetical protein